MISSNKLFNLKLAGHFLFWMASVVFWSFIFNPDTSGYGIFGFGEFWPMMILIISICYIITLLPFIWILKGIGKKIKIAVSVIFILLFCILIVERLFPGAVWEKLKDYSEIYFQYFFYVIVFHVTVVGAVYYNLGVLIKKYLNNNKLGLYLLVLAGLAIGSSVANIVLFDYIIDPVFPGLFYISYLKLWETVIVISLYLVLTTSVFLILKYRHFLIAEREKSRDELSALKSQINPHFLFNNLNTIYYLASANDARTKEVVLQLSDFLRYVLYDTASDRILLSKEIETIKTYVELQKERLNPKITEVELIINGDFGNSVIAPLLLLPLAENCFKHGIRKDYGKITLDISFDGKRLSFRTENPVAKQDTESNGNYGGIGISNVEKRLSILYPDKYKFRYGASEGKFILEMEIKLREN